ncbi:MAG: hypothetical protein AUI14_24700 [Actinobacteria bacterium 13_2_20CM_2_71_6]|nr:MAG: hypothetical protein AUI14_24700 [Actinobacteria bacterium 13_2_20CM_2_71_6]
MAGEAAVGATVGGAVAGCTTSRRPAGGTGVPDLLLADTAAGLARIHGTVPQALGAGVPTPNPTRIYVAKQVGGDTLLQTVDTATGQVSEHCLLAGRWVPRIISPDGHYVALTAPGGNRYRPEGRERSTIVVADSTGERYRLDLAGNYEPDAFARDDTCLFVLEWLPPAQPDRYRVRMVELINGGFAPMFTREKALVPVGSEEQMRGEGRQAVFSPGAQTLYTLYTQPPAGQWASGESKAFVHTLDVSVGWAYCLDLPEPFGDGPAAGHTIAATPDGQALLVADLTSGRLAVADPQTLTVRTVATIPTGTGTACSVAAPDSKRLYLGSGTQVRVVDLHSQTSRAWDAGGEVRGLAVSADSQRLYVGYPDAVGWCSPVDGTPLGRIPVPGLRNLLVVV